MSMSTNAPLNRRVQGQLLQLGKQHEIAIYLRNGERWVAEFRDGHAELIDASTWFRFLTGPLRSSHRHRAAALESATELTPAVLEKIERLHGNVEGRLLLGNRDAAGVFDVMKHNCSVITRRLHGLAARPPDVPRRPV